MKKVNIIYREPVEAEYKELNVYDDLDDYLKDYNCGKDFTRIGIGEWKRLNTNEGIFYSFNGYYDDCFLTEKCYKQLLNYCKKTYKIYEGDLFRTQKNSNTRFTGELSSIDEVIEYMKDEKQSWLPQICKEIDEDIEELNKKINEIKVKINNLENDKKKLYDEDYLKSKIKVEYTFDSQYYKSIRNNLFKSEVE